MKMNGFLALKPTPMSLSFEDLILLYRFLDLPSKGNFGINVGSHTRVSQRLVSKVASL